MREEASEKVERAMHERKRDAAVWQFGKRVTSRKQAIAIGLSEARRAVGRYRGRRPAAKAVVHAAGQQSLNCWLNRATSLLTGASVTRLRPTSPQARPASPRALLPDPHRLTITSTAFSMSCADTHSAANGNCARLRRVGRQQAHERQTRAVVPHGSIANALEAGSPYGFVSVSATWGCWSSISFISIRLLDVDVHALRA
jgi:hypothetical protein